MGSSATTTASTMDQTDPASGEDGNVSSFHLPHITDSSQDTLRRNRKSSKRQAKDKGVQGIVGDDLSESEKEEGGEEGTQERDTLHKHRNRSSAVSRALGREYRKILNLSRDDDMQSDLRKKETKPRYNMVRDGVICSFCGATTSYGTQRLMTYPSPYMCGDCAITQERQAPAPIQQDTATHNGANLIQIYEEQLKDLERDVRLNFFGSTHEEEAGFDQLAGLMKRSRIPNGTHEQHSQQYQMRGQLLVAGGMSWTVEESNLFFQGLRRFGKHNVWAIQEFIKTRSLAEVVTMIETMEMELARRKSLGLKTIRLSEMPMATEVDDKVIAIEEKCASRLIDQEMKTFWKQHARSPPEATPEIVDKTRLFNMRTLSDLASRLYIQNEGASMEREVVQSLYDTLKEWLTPVVKELVALQHERHRVTALLKKDDYSDAPSITEMDVLRTLHARQLPLDADAFFSTAHNRLQYMLFDDSAVIPITIPGLRRYIPAALSDYGKQYYLNAEADLVEAEAEDSDQGTDTDDGVQAEEEEEDIPEAPFPVLQPSLDPRIGTSGVDHAAKIYTEQEPSLQLWESFWSTRAREARKISANVTGESEDDDLVTQPAKTATTMSYDIWRSDLARLEDTSFAIPKTDGVDSRLKKHILAADFQSMNKTGRSYEQRLYLERLSVDPPSSTLEANKLERIATYVSALDAECKIEAGYKNSEQPGYGPLPKNTSLLLDLTREAPTTGYGIGKRGRGGLWQIDKYVDDSGYITVSGSDDEEEEGLGYERQIKADMTIDKASQVLGWEDVFAARNGSKKRQKRGSSPSIN